MIRWETDADAEPDVASLHAALDALRIDRMQAYIALGWLPSGDMARVDPPPRTWSNHIRTILELADRSHETRLRMVAAALDEWEADETTASDELRSQLDEIPAPEKSTSEDDRTSAI